MKHLSKSRALYNAALELIPWATQTNAKRARSELEDVYPLFIARGKGARIWDVDGNAYLDFKCALGPIVLGYADDEVNAAVKRQIDDGTMYNMAHPLEVELAKAIRRCVPCAERVRYLKSGSDANSAAVRIARTVTGREKLISVGYHGWHDTVNAKRVGMGGIPRSARELVVDGPINDLDALKTLIREHGAQTALLLLDLACHRDVDPDYVRQLRNLADENGILLGFDEIITGFRYALGGAQEYFGVTPDLACFGKGLANGYSIAALCGRAEIMDAGFEKTVITGTYYGATADLAAAVATVAKLERERVPAFLWRQGEKLKRFINETAVKHGAGIRAEGPACIFNLAGGAAGERTRFLRKLLEKGLFPGASYWFIQFSHTDDILEEAFGIIDAALRER